jgi:30S ribosomal protein S31
MGKGDKKSRRGKIIIGSFGVRRPRKIKKAAIPAVKTPKPGPKKAQEPKPKKVAEEVVIIDNPVVITEPVVVAEPLVEVAQTELELEVKPAKPAAKKTAAKKTEKADAGEAKPKVVKTKKKAAEPEDAKEEKTEE